MRFNTAPAWRRLPIAAAALAALSAQAADIVLFNTGVAADGTTLAAGALDPHWSIVSGSGITSAQPAVVLSNQHPQSQYYTSTDSAWVWVAANGQGAVNSPYVFRLTFDLSGLDPATAVLSGGWGADNRGGMLLNGAVPSGTGIVSPASPSLNNFNTVRAFSMTGGFVAGVNTLDFVVTDQANPGGFNITGLHGTAAAVPEPAAAALGLAGGLALLGWRRWQGRARADDMGFWR